MVFVAIIVVPSREWSEAAVACRRSRLAHLSAFHPARVLTPLPGSAVTGHVAKRPPPFEANVSADFPAPMALDPPRLGIESQPRLPDRHPTGEPGAQLAE